MEWDIQWLQFCGPIFLPLVSSLALGGIKLPPY